MDAYEISILVALVEEYINDVAEGHDVPVTFPSEHWPGKTIKIELIDNP